MRSRLIKIVEMAAVLALGFLLNSCGSQPFCPTCGTTVNGAYGVLNVVPVPEHNPTGEPGGPFNSFDISWFDPIQQKVYTSDRIGLDVVVTDAKNNFAVNTIGGINQVANAGNNFSPCWGPQLDPVNEPQGILLYRHRPGKRKFLQGLVTDLPGSAAGTRLHSSANFGNAFPGFGPNSGSFGGLPGAQCCASRANGVNHSLRPQRGFS